MGSPCSPGIVSIEVLVKRNVITEIFVFLEQRVERIYLALSVTVFKKDLRQAPGELGGDLTVGPERGRAVARVVVTEQAAGRVGATAAHRRRDAFGMRNGAELTRYAIRRGLIEP